MFSGLNEFKISRNIFIQVGKGMCVKSLTVGLLSVHLGSSDHFWHDYRVGRPIGRKVLKIMFGKFLLLIG